MARKFKLTLPRLLPRAPVYQGPRGKAQGARNAGQAKRLAARITERSNDRG